MGRLIFVLLYLFAIAYSQNNNILQYQSYDDVISNFRSIPYNITSATNTVANLKKWYQLYAFLDIAADPPQPFYPPVDILGSLTELLSKEYIYDFDFHTDIRLIFLQLHDVRQSFVFVFLFL